MLHVICSCIFHAYIPNFVSIILILNCLVLFCMSLSLSPFFSLALVCSMTPKHKSTPSWNPLHSSASSSSSSPLIALHLTSSSMMIKPIRNFWRTSHDEAFIQNAKSFYRIFLILTFPLSSIVGLGVIVWHLGHLSLHDHTGVLLQYAWIRLYSTSFCHLRSRHAYRSHFGSYIRDATHTKGRVC